MRRYRVSKRRSARRASAAAPLELSPILRGRLAAIGTCGAIISMPSFAVLIQRIAVVGAIADQILRLGLIM
jgi:hypothetical protein